jgi:hypothetical protein
MNTKHITPKISEIGAIAAIFMAVGAQPQRGRSEPIDLGRAFQGNL